MKWGTWAQTIWPLLLRVTNHFNTLYYQIITRPLARHSSTSTIHLPFSTFYFRPVYAQDSYMALGVWEPYVRKALSSLLSPTSVFIDVGAYIGYHTAFASKIVGQDGLVIAIEPDQRNLSVLLKNCRHFKNIIVHKAVAGSREGVAYIELLPNPVLSRMTNNKRASKEVCQKVNCIALNGLIPLISSKKPASVVVKIDVEGAEATVILGSLELARTLRPYLIVEKDDPGEIEEILRPLGYKSSRLFATYWLFTADAKEHSQ